MSKLNVTRGLSLLAILTFSFLGYGTSSPSSSTSAPGATPAAAAPATGGRRSCVIPSTGTCEWSDLAEAFSEDAVRDRCTGLQGTYGTTPCPTLNLVGHCVPNIGSKEVYYYSTDPMNTPEGAARFCTMSNGTWHAGQ